MKKDHKQYLEVRKKAQKHANEYGFDYGIEFNKFYGYRYFMLPSKSSRSGHELQCEVVSCEDLSKCQPGHGPGAVDDNRHPTYHGQII